MRRFSLVLLCGLVLAGCGESEAPPSASASGEVLFNHHCAACHRPEGTGNFLKGIPANALTRMNIEQVVTLIRKGDPEKPKMPTFSQLSHQQSERIARHLWTLREDLLLRYAEP